MVASSTRQSPPSRTSSPSRVGHGMNMMSSRRAGAAIKSHETYTNLTDAFFKTNVCWRSLSSVFVKGHTRGLSFRWYGANVPKVVIVALMRKMITTRRTRHVGADIRDCELRRVWLLRLNARTSPAEKAADAKLHRTRYEPSRSRKPSGGDDAGA